MVRAHAPVALVLATLWLLLPRTSAAQGSRRSDPLKEFDRRVTAYLDLRKAVEARIGSLPKTSQPAEITRRQHALGAAIREARTQARAGDLFAPVAGRIRRMIVRDLVRRRPVERRAFVVEQPDVALNVDDFYPSTEPLATVPPRLLARLPRLPDGLEYRFAGNALLLRDVDPNLVIDVLPDAIPPRFRKR